MKIAKIEARCILCVRKAIKAEYCQYHYEALQSLMHHYKVWKSSCGEITWYDYLTKLKEISYTGKWVREIIEMELRNVKNE